MLCRPPLDEASEEIPIKSDSSAGEALLPLVSFLPRGRKEMNTARRRRAIPRSGIILRAAPAHKKDILSDVSFCELVRLERLELSRYYHYRLKIARLPVPPQPHIQFFGGTPPDKKVVRLVRLELTRPCDHYPLKVARLPFRHSRIWCLRTESNR